MREIYDTALAGRNIGKGIVNSLASNPTLQQSVEILFDKAFEAFLDAPTLRGLEKYLDVMINTGYRPDVRPYILAYEV